MYFCVQVERLEVVNKQYVRVILVPGADADTVSANWSSHSSSLFMFVLLFCQT